MAQAPSTFSVLPNSILCFPTSVAPGRLTQKSEGGKLDSPEAEGPASLPTWVGERGRERSRLCSGKAGDRTWGGGGVGWCISYQTTM